MRKFSCKKRIFWEEYHIFYLIKIIRSYSITYTGHEEHVLYCQMSHFAKLAKSDIWQWTPPSHSFFREKILGFFVAKLPNVTFLGKMWHLAIKHMFIFFLVHKIYEQNKNYWDQLCYHWSFYFYANESIFLLSAIHKNWRIDVQLI